MASIETRALSDGTVVHRVRFRHDGKNIARPFDTRETAEAFRGQVAILGAARAIELLADRHASQPAVQRTVSQQVKHYIDHRTGITDGTRRKYRKIAAARIDSATLGQIPIHHVTSDDVSLWYNSMAGSPKTKANIQGLLSTALESAVTAGLIARNAAKGVRGERTDAPAKEHVYLSATEAATLIECIDPFWRPLPLFLLATGVRFGEATALTVGDLDLAHRSARIVRAWKDGAGGPAVIGPPKSRRSKRTVAIPASLIDGLREHVKDKPRDAYVFTNRRGNPISSSVWHEGAWTPAMATFKERTKLRPRVHDLRHTYASWAIATGTPLPVIQRQMGHESIKTTVDTYGHLVRADFDALASAIDKSLPTPKQIGPKSADDALPAPAASERTCTFLNFPPASS